MPKRILQGVVVSDKGQKTVVVKIERRFQHPVLQKIISRTKRYQAHDEDDRYQTGDVVRIEECAPISKTKTWRVIGLGSKA
ncbi:MAG: 30S ribosomal protein S17 [Proteobacteria bacterium]|nr:30S ribosomal protein S17 [Pseudomonadota bacterium]